MLSKDWAQLCHGYRYSITVQSMNDAVMFFIELVELRSNISDDAALAGLHVWCNNIDTKYKLHCVSKETNNSITVLITLLFCIYISYVKVGQATPTSTV